MENNNSSTISKAQKTAFRKLFNGYKEEAKKEFASIESDISAIAKFKQDYIDGKTDAPSVKTKIDNLYSQFLTKYTDSKTKHEAIIKLYTELFEGTSTTDSIEDTINNLVADSETKVVEIETKKKELENFYEKVFGKAEKDKIITEGYKQKFDSELKKISDFLTNQQEKYEAQFEQIKSLLPGATSIGLATAFEDQKKSYTISIIIWSLIFVMTMLGMLGFGVYYIVQISKIADLDVSKALIALVNKLPFFVPTVWLAIFASKQQSQNKRLQQEYAFKETFAKSYDGQKTQLEKLGLEEDEENEILKQLLVNLVDITSHNPSATLESDKHNEKTPLTQAFDRFLPKKKNEKNDD